MQAIHRADGVRARGRALREGNITPDFGTGRWELQSLARRYGCNFRSKGRVTDIVPNLQSTIWHYLPWMASHPLFRRTFLGQSAATGFGSFDFSLPTLSHGSSDEKHLPCNFPQPITILYSEPPVVRPKTGTRLLVRQMRQLASQSATATAAAARQAGSLRELRGQGCTLRKVEETRL